MSTKTGAINNGKMTNGQHNGNAKISSRPLPSSTLPAQKSLILTYLLWLIGGFFGLHHLYLQRDRQAFVYWCTLGGYFGIGWFYDLFLIPSYVRDANEDPVFIKQFVQQLKTHARPPYSSKRLMSAVMVGYFFGQLIQLAIPQTTFAGIDWSFLHWLVPLGIALGVWLIGNIGREQGVLWHCLLAAFAAYPMRYFIYDETYTFLGTAIVSALVFDHFSKQWLRTPPKRNGVIKRTIRFSSAICIYFAIWGCFLYFNGTIKDDDGVDVPVHEAVRNFLASAWWNDLSQALKDTYNYAQHHGWYETWKEIMESLDVDGERNAYKVLGVSATASQAEITTAYRKLSKEYHPDKVKDIEKRAAANQRFIEIQQAYNVLSKIKSSRRRKNKQYKDDEAIVL